MTESDIIGKAQLHDIKPDYNTEPKKNTHKKTTLPIHFCQLYKPSLPCNGEPNHLNTDEEVSHKTNSYTEIFISCHLSAKLARTMQTIPWHSRRFSSATARTQHRDMLRKNVALARTLSADSMPRRTSLVLRMRSSCLGTRLRMSLISIR